MTDPTSEDLTDLAESLAGLREIIAKLYGQEVAPCGSYTIYTSRETEWLREMDRLCQEFLSDV